MPVQTTANPIHRSSRSISDEVLVNNNINTQNAHKTHELKQREYRKSLVIWKHPLICCQLFMRVVIRYIKSLIKEIINHKVTWLLGIIIILLFCSVFLFPNSPFSAYIKDLYIYTEWILWWLILGILSSIGLGTGMHSGLLFLFPFIAEVCLVASTCHNLQFDTFGTDAFHCKNPYNEKNNTITFMGLFWKVFWPCLFWGTGTAVGEIPPYAVSLAASRAGEEDEFTEISQELQSSPRNFFTSMKLWMISFLEKYGFWAVLAFAAWPNMAFDMCGIACGHFQMSFLTFFGATFIGKALIKVNMQAMFFIVIFNENTLIYVMNTINKLGLTSIGKPLHEILQKEKQKFIDPQHSSSETTTLKAIWNIILAIFMGFFFCSIIQAFAQQEQKNIDEQKNNERKTKKQL